MQGMGQRNCTFARRFGTEMAETCPKTRFGSLIRPAISHFGAAAALLQAAGACFWAVPIDHLNEK